MNIILNNKRALVCGGSQGIGRAIALQFARSGAEVTAVSRNSDNLELILSEISGISNLEHRAIQDDSANPGEFS